MRRILPFVLVSILFGCGGGEAAPNLGRQDGPAPPVCLTSCDQAGANCGPVGDGCGGLLQCGDCQAPDTCGGAGVPGVCGRACVPRTCADQNIGCGPAGDGCGGLLHCGDCQAPETCGGSTHGQCGGNNGCLPKTCAQQGLHCGPAGDGCGGVIQCGTCTAPDSCGGAGIHGACGHSGTSSACTPKTCADLGYDCGPAGNGCGGLLDCGACTAPKTCGGGGQPGRCGGNSGCVPKTCAQQGLTCGPAGDGCGGVLQCGTCTAPQTCGGAGTPGVCGGSNACTPRTCADLGFDCGPAGDGCGGLIQCGTCTPPDICGGGTQPGVCGGGHPDGGVPCTNLCLKKVRCDGGALTTISGTVYNPAGTDPIYNALVYVPNAPVEPFTAGVTCDKCGANVSGAPLVRATTGPDGKFTLSDVPVGASIPLVVQVGKWRRQVTIPTVTGCTDNVLPASLTRLPKNKAEGDIPQIAVVTGAVDAIECVLRKMGVDDAEFTNPAGYPAGSTGAGRIHFYYANDSVEEPPLSGNWYGWGAWYDNSTPNSHVLTGSAAQLAKYDMVIFACEGLPLDTKRGDQQNVINYANMGGRVFTTHYSYDWLTNGYVPATGPAPFSGTASWQFWQTFPADPLTATVDVSFPKGQAFSQWLGIVGAQSAPGKVAIHDPRRDVLSVVAPTQRWLYSSTPQTVQHLTFNTPVGTAAADQCGRVLFSDFHVTHDYTYYDYWPAECDRIGTTLSPQEKILEFMVFDLSNCIAPDNPPPPPSCTPKTCAQLGFTCGPAGNGCGGALNCGPCTLPDSCGGGGVPGQCGHTSCPAKSCAQQSLSCGPAGDGCGNQIDCGPCTPPDTCGGGGVPGQCGHASCTKITCASQGLSCGPAGDGCGGQLDCGPCVAPDTCGGAGTPGQCGHNASCQPYTCAELFLNCGPASDGCGGLLQCGTCVPPDTCGGAGSPGVCGHNPCVAATCAEQGLECGPAGDGCGGLLDCGTCVAPETCGGAGLPGICGAIQPPG
ncbi:MAG TPA: carboxypeptidase-like regulatory domain-containing protein [Polyangia bacterium]|jgi:hypothetical protein